MDIYRPLSQRKECRPYSWVDVNLKKVQSNYTQWKALVEPSICSAVLKANAYGLGAVSIGQALLAAGCRHFFVAYLDEAIAFYEGLKELGASPSSVPDSSHYRLFILDGPLTPEAHDVIEHYRFIPVLNTLENAIELNAYAKQHSQKLPAVMHFDTGLRRLGLPTEDVATFKEIYAQGGFPAIDWIFFMSHAAASSIPEHASNTLQLNAVQRLREDFSNIPFSYADSEAVLLGRKTHCDMVRVGIGLYGVHPFLPGLQNCISIFSTILQIQDVPAGQGIGYDWCYSTTSPRRIATLACGYADGITHQKPDRDLYFYLHGHKVPILGRVSMDLCVIDVTDVPDTKVGDTVEIIGDHASIADYAAANGIPDHRVLTGLGDRLWRFFS